MERELLTWFEPLGSAMSQASAIIRLVPSSEFFSSVSQYCGLPWVAHMVKNLPAIQETWVRSLGQEDPLEKGIATHSSILAWRIPWTEEPGRLQSMGSQKESDTTERLNNLPRECQGISKWISWV